MGAALIFPMIDETRMLAISLEVRARLAVHVSKTRPPAYGVCNQLADLPEVLATVSAACLVQVMFYICRDVALFHKYVDFIAFRYVERSRIINVPSVVIFASHGNTSLS